MKFLKMIKLLKGLFSKNPINRKLIAENDRKEWKDLCNKYNIVYGDELSMYSVIVSDYTPDRFQEIQAKIENRIPLVNDLYALSWNGDHLHFKIVQVGRKDLYLY